MCVLMSRCNLRMPEDVVDIPLVWHGKVWYDECTSATEIFRYLNRQNNLRCTLA